MPGWLRALSLLPYLVGCVVFWNISAMPTPPVPDMMQFEFSDKLMHAGAYAGLAGLAAIGLRDQPARRLLIAAALLSTGYGVVDEIHQSFVEGRTASVGDALADAIGATLGAATAVLLRSRFSWLGGRHYSRTTPGAASSAQAS